MKLQTQPNKTCYFVQLQLFPESDQEKNAREIAELRSSCDKLRKSLHAKHGGLAKAYDQLKWELDQLKRSICRHEKIGQEQGAFL